MDTSTIVFFSILGVAIVAAILSVAISAIKISVRFDEELNKVKERPVLTRKELAKYDGNLLFPLDYYMTGGKFIRVDDDIDNGPFFPEIKLLHVDDEFYEYASLIGWNSWSGVSTFRFDLVDFDDWLQRRAVRRLRRERLREEFGSN